MPDKQNASCHISCTDTHSHTHTHMQHCPTLTHNGVSWQLLRVLYMFACLSLSKYQIWLEWGIFYCYTMTNMICLYNKYSCIESWVRWSCSIRPIRDVLLSRQPLGSTMDWKTRIKVTDWCAKQNPYLQRTDNDKYDPIQLTNIYPAVHRYDAIWSRVRGMRYDDIRSWNIKMSPQSACTKRTLVSCYSAHFLICMYFKALPVTLHAQTFFWGHTMHKQWTKKLSFASYCA